MAQHKNTEALNALRRVKGGVASPELTGYVLNLVKSADKAVAREILAEMLSNPALQGLRRLDVLQQSASLKLEEKDFKVYLVLLFVPLCC